MIAGPCAAQTATQQNAAPNEPRTQRYETVGMFLAGGALGLAAHEAGHLLLDVVFDADPGLRRVEFHGLPFFAISHRSGLPRAQEFAISSAGFWIQQAGSEWLLTRRPNLRGERAPLAKGFLAFHVLASASYAGAALFRTGPSERDTLGMAVGSGLDERWIAPIVLGPAVFDAWRYYRPDSRGAIWLSRAAKVGGVLLVARAAAR